MFKPSVAQSEKYTVIMRQLLDKSVTNPLDYQFIHVYNFVTKHYIIFKRSITTNYILAYTESMNQFALLHIADRQENDHFTVEEKVIFSRNDIVSFKKNLFGKHVLKLNDGSEYRFYVQPYIPAVPGTFTLPVLQEEKVGFFLQAIK